MFPQIASEEYDLTKELRKLPLYNAYPSGLPRWVLCS